MLYQVLNNFESRVFENAPISPKVLEFNPSKHLGISTDGEYKCGIPTCAHTDCNVDVHTICNTLTEKERKNRRKT